MLRETGGVSFLECRPVMERLMETWFDARVRVG